MNYRQAKKIGKRSREGVRCRRTTQLAAITAIERRVKQSARYQLLVKAMSYQHLQSIYRRKEADGTK